jgi:hypothetical protein
LVNCILNGLMVSFRWYFHCNSCLQVMSQKINSMKRKQWVRALNISSKADKIHAHIKNYIILEKSEYRYE